MQRYCPNNSNFTFREITCAPPKCEDKKEKDECNYDFGFLPPFWSFCPPPPPPCDNKKKSNCPCCCPNCRNTNNCNDNCCQKNSGSGGSCCAPKLNSSPCNNFPCGCKDCNINLFLDPRFILWTSLYPCIFKNN